MTWLLQNYPWLLLHLNALACIMISFRLMFFRKRSMRRRRIMELLAYGLILAPAYTAFRIWHGDYVQVDYGEILINVVVCVATEIRYDRAAHALTITLAEGGTYKIIGKGTLDGPVEITETLTVQGVSQFNADANVAGNIGATQEISDGTGKMSGIRQTFNDHDHRGDSGGTTGKPNQKM